MKYNNKKFLMGVLATGIITITSGCASTSVKESRELNTNAAYVAQERMAQAENMRMSNSSFSVDNGFFAAKTPLYVPEINTKARLPEAFKNDASITRQSPTLISELSSHITRMSGYRVDLAPDVLEGSDASLSEVMYKGNLAGLLDYIAAQANVSWAWKGDHISIYKYETKMFNINALAGVTDVSTTLDTTTSSSGDSEGSASSGQSGQRTKIDSVFNLWEEVEEALSASLSPAGSMSVSPSIGVVTVTDSPSVLKIIESQINEFNRIYSRQVVLNVKVYSVERSASDSVETDWSVAWNEAAERFGLNFNNPNTPSNYRNQTGFSASILDGPFAGSGLLVNALSSIGRTTLVTSGTISSLNGQSVPLNVSREQAYLESYSTTLTSGDAGNSTTTLTPGVVTDGFSMNVTPRILPNNKVMLRYSIDLSSTDAIDTFEAPDGNSAIQLPRRSVRNFLQNVSMQSGQTMVLTGFQQTGGGANQAGPFSSKAWLFGGRRSTENMTRTIVIVVSPFVVE